MLVVVAFSLTLAAPDPVHWAFVPPARPGLPGGEATHPIDSFHRNKLAAAGLTPAAEADRRTLVRRVYFDLLGLPPTPAEAAAFLNDTEPKAYERLVDKLLASRHFGERQAQHWFDLVRFAESNGYELDADRPQAWRYRDYVVRGFNADKPYDRFVTEQLAGDLLSGADLRANPDLLIATGLQRCGPTHVVVGSDPRVVRQENLTEMVTGLGAAVLGMTVHCARCHDHKFDPISAADYYRFEAFFASARHREVPLASNVEKETYAAAAGGAQQMVAPLRKRIADIEAPVRAKLAAAKKAALDVATRAALDTPSDKRTPTQKQLVKAASTDLKVSWDEVIAAIPTEDRAKREQWQADVRSILAKVPPPPAAAWAAVHEDPVPPTHVLKRGDLDRKGPAVTPAFPAALAAADLKPKSRLDLARWLTAKDHPLTARVAVNRVWQQHFGRGIVATATDFGTKGDPPTHPELLDWLAKELVEPGDGGTPWSLKRIHRLVVTSAAYRMRSDTEVSPKDPENKLLGRQTRKRRDAEAIRDAVLVTAGTLNRAVGGPSIKTPLEPEVYDLLFTEDEPVGLWNVHPDAKQFDRRSLYLFAKRNVRLPVLEVFDKPDSLTPCAVRGVSTTAPQALTLMNGPFAREQAKRLAATIAKDTPRGKWVESLYERGLNRKPTDAELRIAETFLNESSADAGLADLSLAMFNLNEFVFVP